MENAETPLITLIKELLEAESREKADELVSEIRTYSTEAILPIIGYGVRPGYDGIAPDLVEFLREMCDSTLAVTLDCLQDKDIFLVWHAAFVVGELGDERAAVGLGNLLEDLLSRPAFGVMEHQVCDTAIRSLGYLGEVGAQVLFELFPVITSATFRDRVVRALAQTKSQQPQYYQLFLSLPDDPDINIRRSAVIGLGNFSDSNTLVLLLNLADNPNVWIKQAAIIGLGNFSKDSKAAAKLQENVTHPDNTVREVVIEILATWDNTKFFDLFMKAAQDSHPNVRSRAVEQLGKSKNELAIPIIVTALSDKFGSVRMQALWALERLCSPQQLAKNRKALEKFISQENEEKIKQKAQALLKKIDIISGQKKS